MKLLRNNQKGFTLVELAIVLVVIGLLLGAILKGQAMIKNAKVKRIKSDIDSIVAATYNYQDKYGYLPGDDPNDRTSDLDATSCTGGNGDGLFNQGAIEYACFWQELAGAGYISGDPGQHSEIIVAKRSPFGGTYRVRYYNNLHSSGKSGNAIYVDNIPLDVIKWLDTKYDDGIYNKGDIQSSTDYSAKSTAYSDIYWFAF